MKLLARREHSRFELQRKLRARGFDAAEVDPVLDELRAEGLQSDARFAEVYVRARAERGFGPLKIVAELRGRGVSDELIEESLQVPPQPWLDSARAQHRKRFGERPPRGYADRARQSRFLQGRGFDGETIRSVLDNVESP